MTTPSSLFSTLITLFGPTLLQIFLLSSCEAVPPSPAVTVATMPYALPLPMTVPNNILLFGGGMTLAKQSKPDCPYCDSSVFPYCSDKLLHDACCCLNPYESSLPRQCELADCSFLHANTCKEHRLITRCCCDRLLYIKR